MKTLEQLRQQLDATDHKILVLLAERMKVSKEIGQYKKEHSIAIQQPAQEKKLSQDISLFVQQNHLSSNFVEKVYALILEESKNVQKEIIDKELRKR